MEEEVPRDGPVHSGQVDFPHQLQQLGPDVIVAALVSVPVYDHACSRCTQDTDADTITVGAEQRRSSEWIVLFSVQLPMDEKR